jgi:hypothetical protein
MHFSEYMDEGDALLLFSMSKKSGLDSIRAAE